MARRSMNRLIATQLNKLPAGMHPDGGNLWLQVSAAGTRSWSFRFTMHGKQREMGLGPLTTITLAEARAKALEARKQLLDGIDPIEARKALRTRAALAAATAMTFKACAEAYIDAHKAGWKNPVHAAQWPATMQAYVYPAIGDTPVQSVDVDHVLKVLNPIWTTKTETASRVRGRMERIIDWAKVRGYRNGENPARLRGNLDHLLPRKSKVQKVEHHAALPYADAPAFAADLRRRSGNGARALEFTILTAARTGEVIGATWPEIDIAAKTWTIPAERMKANREHVVPLSDRAMEIIGQVQGLDELYVFPGSKPKTGLSNMSLSAVLKRMERDGITVHGFRSTFRDWASEETAYPHEVCEMALAHTIGNKAEKAYRRGDLLAKRRAMMTEWATYSASAPTPADAAAEDTVLALAADVAKRGRSANRAVRDAIDAATAFADVDLGDGAVIDPIHRGVLGTPVELAGAASRRRGKRSTVVARDELSPPEAPTYLDARDATVRRLQRELEAQRG